MNKPYFCEGSEAMTALEAMVDTVGMSNVLYALAHIARAKAEHVQTNWQDRALAKTWNSDAHQCDKAATTVNN